MSLATATKGAALHWNGPPMGLLDCDGSQCERAWEGIRRYHVEKKGWRDIAYSFGVCPGCGRRLTGRGWGVRTAANGTTYGNDHYHAFMVLFGEGEPLTDKAKAGVRDLAAEHKRRYGGMRLVRHRDLKSTTCPGPEASGWVANGAPDPRGEPEPDPEDDGMKMELWTGPDPERPDDDSDHKWLVQRDMAAPGNHLGYYTMLTPAEAKHYGNLADNPERGDVIKATAKAARSWFTDARLARK